MGNRLSQPNFGLLVEILVILSKYALTSSHPNYNPNIQMSDIKFKISQSDQTCLNCIDFWGKILCEKEYSIKQESIGELIEIYAYQSEVISEVISIAIVKGIYRANYDDLKPFLDGANCLCNINDSLMQSRIEWVLGYPTLEISNQVGGINNFGVYGISTLEDNIVQFDSTLNIDNSTSVLELIATNRKRVENLCIIGLKSLLILMESNKVAFDYILRLPTFNYIFAKFTDFMRPFIESYISESKKYNYWPSHKEEMGKQCLEAYEKVESLIEKQTNLYIQQYNQQQGENICQGIYKPYIIGKTISSQIVSQKRYEVNENSKDKVYITEVEYNVFYMDSFPDSTTNRSLPSEVLNKQFICTNQLDNQSVWHCFLHSHQIHEFNQREATAQRVWNAIQKGETQVIKIKQKFNNNQINMNNVQPLIASDSSEDKEEQQNEERKDEVQQDEQEEYEDISFIKASNCVRQFKIQNESNHYVNVKIEINGVQNENEIFNMNTPKSTYTTVIKPQGYFQNYIFCKYIPENNWPEYTYTASVEILGKQVDSTPQINISDLKNY